MTAIDRKTMLSIAAELNEKREAGIKTPSKLTNDRLTAAILAATDNGKDLKKLTKQTRAAITALANPEQPAEESTTDEPSEESAAAEEAQAEEQEQPQAEEPQAPSEPAEESTTDEPDLRSREALNLAAVDMNEVMGLEPGIDTSLGDEMFMRAFIKASEMATGTDNFRDFTWRVLAAHDLGPERVLPQPVKKAPKDGGKMVTPKEKTKRLGVIGSIRKFVEDRAAAEDPTLSLVEILDMLKKSFPQKDEDSMMATVRTQVPGRVRKELGFTFEKVAVGKFKVSAPVKAS